MSPQKQLRVIKLVKIVDGIAGAELDPLDLLEIDKKYLLERGGASAVFNPLEGFF